MDAVNKTTVLVECLDTHDRVLSWQRFTLEDGNRTLTIGRSLLADVTLNDEHAAALHASLDIAPDGSVAASDLDSVNGLVIAGKRYHQVQGRALPDNTVQVGRTVIRVRTSGQDLAPEKSDHHASEWVRSHPAWIAGLGVFAMTGLTVYYSWLEAPRDLLSDIVSETAFGAVTIALWVAVWALLSRVMLGEWRWLRHAAVILVVSSFYLVIGDLFDLGLFMFTPFQGQNIVPWLAGLALAHILYLHMRTASRLSVHRAAVLACIMPALIIGVVQWMSMRSAAQNVNSIDAQVRIYPPGFRVYGSGTLDSYFAGVAGLRETAKQRRDALPPTAGDDLLSIYSVYGFRPSRSDQTPDRRPGR